MCRYQALYHNERTGYVVRCMECEKIQVAYGNLMMTFSQADFGAFRLWIMKVKDEQTCRKQPSARRLVLQSPCQGIHLLLSLNELEEFVALLETADAELQSLELINLFN